MKNPASIATKVVVEDLGALDALSLYTYLRGHVRNVSYDTATDIAVDIEQVENPETWGETLTGTGLRNSSLTAAKDGSCFSSPLTIDGWEFPVEPLVTVTASKVVVTTQMSEGVGPVVEEVADEGYTVVIRGVLINEDNDDYPYDQVARINNLRTKLGGLAVQNKILNKCYGIDKIVIKSISVPGEEGSQSMQSYTITAVSDRDVQLELREGWS